MENKRNKVFISHSEKDSELANCLSSLILQMGSSLNIKDMHVFRSGDSLQRSLDELKPQIIKAMEESFHCIVICSRNSLESSWVKFEIGLATAQNKLTEKKKSNIKNLYISAVKTEGVDIRQIELLKELHLKSFSNEKNVQIFLKAIFKDWYKRNGDDFDENKFTKYFTSPEINKLADELIKLSKERIAYIVGSRPNSDNCGDWWSKSSEKFIKSLSDRLLDKEFKLSSFPTVENVGKFVLEVISEKKQFHNYEIAGLYNFDKNSNIDLKSWDDLLSKLRRIYLSNKEWMIIIGGGDGTKNEYMEAVKMPTIKTLPIPCFKGFGFELFQKNKADHPCRDCPNIVKEGDFECTRIEKIIEKINKIN